MYRLKVEVLRNDLADSDEKGADIALDGVSIGDCNPDGSDLDCTFLIALLRLEGQLFPLIQEKLQ